MVWRCIFNIQASAIEQQWPKHNFYCKRDRFFSFKSAWFGLSRVTVNRGYPLYYLSRRRPLSGVSRLVPSRREAVCGSGEGRLLHGRRLFSVRQEFSRTVRHFAGCVFAEESLLARAGQHSGRSHTWNTVQKVRKPLLLLYCEVPGINV